MDYAFLFSSLIKIVALLATRRESEHGSALGCWSGMPQEELAWLHLRDESEADDVSRALRSAYTISKSRTEPGPLVLGLVE